MSRMSFIHVHSNSTNMHISDYNFTNLKVPITVFLQGFRKLNIKRDFLSLLSFVLSRYSSTLSITHNCESSGNKCYENWGELHLC